MPAGPGDRGARWSGLPVPAFTSGVSLLSPPVFRDERLTDVARLIYGLGAVTLVTGTVFPLLLIAVMPSNAAPLITLIVGLWAMVGAAVALVRSGRVVGGARAMVAGTWVVTCGFALGTGGVDSPAAAGMLITIVVAGILVGWQETAVAAVAVVGAGFFMAWAGAAGLSLVRPMEFSLLYRAGLLAGYTSGIAALVVASNRNLRKAVASARLANAGLAMAGKIYDVASEGIIVTTPDGSIIDANEAYLRIHGYERADVIGQNPRMMKSGKHGPEFYREMWRVLLATDRWQGEVWDRRADGSIFPKWLSIFAVRDRDGALTNYGSVFSDITAMKQGEEDLEWLATHDSLTSLPNRALLVDRLTTAVARSRRKRSAAAVFFFDLDHFKDVNDTRGHPVGDRLLVEIAKRCLAVVRESDTVGRSGGDEFEVIMSDFSATDDLSVLAQRLLAAVEEPVELDGQETHVTASIGIAVYPQDGADAAELTRHADVAMYRAKALGRNRFEFFSEGLQEELQHRVEVEAGLRAAIKEDRLFVAYQPQVDLNTGRIIGLEALVRWRDTDGSVIMPDDFIPVAESSGLILEIGDAVLRKACADMRTLFDAGHRLTMAVNFSGRQLMDQDIAAVVIEAVTAAGLDASYFEVEITESSIMTRADIVAAKVRSLQEEGVCVSIDDFGTGYASMSYVMDFHPSKLKIDRSFVRGLPDDPSAVAIVNATIALAKGIGAKVLAEGPETEDDVRCLRASGCDFGQGFFFSPAVPLAELRALLDKGPFSLPGRGSPGALARLNAGPATTGARSPLVGSHSRGPQS